MATEATLDRVSAGSLTERAFLRDYYFRHRPVILTGAHDAWPALGWTPKTLRDMLGDREVDVRVSASGLLFDNRTGDSTTERMRFSEFVDTITSGRAERTMYFAQQNIRDVIPEWERYLTPRLSFLRWGDHVQATNLWFGDRGSVTPLHFDFGHNYFTQVYGRKEFVIFAPEDRPYLYPNRDQPLFYFVSKVAVHEPDAEAFPEYARARPYRFVLQPSDVLFLPCGWWHCVRSLDVSISINQWWFRVFSRNTRQGRVLAEFMGAFARHKLAAVRDRVRGRAPAQRRGAY